MTTLSALCLIFLLLAFMVWSVGLVVAMVRDGVRTVKAMQRKSILVKWLANSRSIERR